MLGISVYHKSINILQQLTLKFILQYQIPNSAKKIWEIQDQSKQGDQNKSMFPGNPWTAREDTWGNQTGALRNRCNPTLMLQCVQMVRC